MLNVMISGVISPKLHLLQNIQFTGALVMNMLLTDYTADILRHLPYLRQALFGPSGINLLTLLPYDVAGYHVINNDGTPADFNRKIT